MNLLNEIKIQTSYFSEITTNLIFKIFNVNKNDLNNKYNLMNKSAIGLRININNNIKVPIYEPTHTNYNMKTKINDINNDINETFNEKEAMQNIDNYIKKFYSDEKNIETNDEKYINDLLNFSKKFNSYVPNNSIENIITNTSQIIHRKFFELLIKNYFSDIIDIDVDKNKAMPFEHFHDILIVLRRLKKILFTNKNIKYYDEFLFLKE